MRSERELELDKEYHLRVLNTLATTQKAFRFYLESIATTGQIEEIIKIGGLIDKAIQDSNYHQRQIAEIEREVATIKEGVRVETAEAEFENQEVSA